MCLLKDDGFQSKTNGIIEILSDGNSRADSRRLRRPGHKGERLPDYFAKLQHKERGSARRRGKQRIRIYVRGARERKKKGEHESRGRGNEGPRASHQLTPISAHLL